jgi:hypothetical protein
MLLLANSVVIGAGAPGFRLHEHEVENRRGTEVIVNDSESAVASRDVALVGAVPSGLRRS